MNDINLLNTFRGHPLLDGISNKELKQDCMSEFKKKFRSIQVYINETNRQKLLVERFKVLDPEE
jgi:hypothetical protein